MIDIVSGFYISVIAQEENTAADAKAREFESSCNRAESRARASYSHLIIIVLSVPLVSLAARLPVSHTRTHADTHTRINRLLSVSVININYVGLS